MQLKPTKPHYLILDGLRGVAAILVVIYHLLEAIFWENLSTHPIRHGYLAVDFFFLLSGFVVGYAYDDRWGTMTVWQFFRIRLTRLHPLVIIGVIIGAVGFYFDPFTNGMSHTRLWQLIGVSLIAMTLLPQPDIRGWGETHVLNGPSWSLLQEYIGNILYGLFVRKFSKPMLWILVLVCAGALVWLGSWRKHLGTGWSYDTFYIAVIRMLFPFFAGLLLFRTSKMIKVPMAFQVSAALLLVLFLLPWGGKYNGLLEVAIIIIGFPLVIAIGAGGGVSGFWKKICKFAGDISYPIYITHYPFIYIYTAWIAVKKPTRAEIMPVAVMGFLFCMLLAYLALKLYDEPVRAWLKKRFLKFRT
ncbi:MAG: acyltransferase [Chitinophagaceae bacterium]|nr:MAG: acyltransferase [Chitinophagaceae bacterium]